MFSHCATAALSWVSLWTCFLFCLLCFDEVIYSFIYFILYFHISLGQKPQNMLSEDQENFWNWGKKQWRSQLWTLSWKNSNNQLCREGTLGAVLCLETEHLTEIYTIFWLSFKSQLFPRDSLCSRGDMRHLSCNEMLECQAEANLHRVLR